ncbi:hypothetical protein CIB48_g3185 [Xylaria polymorpha]|nr:hypothetical protein CIB48_g3185 [Xylaria polymorpha]
MRTYTKNRRRRKARPSGLADIAEEDIEKPNSQDIQGLPTLSCNVPSSLYQTPKEVNWNLATSTTLHITKMKIPISILAIAATVFASTSGSPVLVDGATDIIPRGRDHNDQQYLRPRFPP